MKRKTIVYFLGLVWIAVMLQLVVIITMKNDGKIVKAFQAGGSVPVESQVCLEGTYQEYLISDNDKKGLLQYVASGLSITNGTTKVKKQNQQKIWTMTSDNNKAKTEIQLLPITSGKEKGKIKVRSTITLQEQIENVIYLKEKLQKIYEKVNMKPKSAITMQGSFEGSLSNARMKSMQESIFKVLEAKTLEEQTVSGAKIYYGYTQRLDEYQMQKGKRRNAELIYTYDEHQNKTSLYLAVPYYNQDF